MKKLSQSEEAILIVLNSYPGGKIPPGIYGLDISRIINADEADKQKKGQKQKKQQTISPGSLYPALQALQDYGYIKGRWGKDVPGQKSSGARRRYYTITDAGVAALNELQTQRKELIQRAKNWRTDEFPEPDEFPESDGNTASQCVAIHLEVV